MIADKTIFSNITILLHALHFILAHNYRYISLLLQTYLLRFLQHSYSISCCVEANVYFICFDLERYKLLTQNVRLVIDEDVSGY